MSIFMPFGGGGETSVSYANIFELPEPTAPYDKISARLLVNNVVVPISDFSFSEEKGRVGADMSFTLAKPETAQLPLAGSYILQLGYQRAGIWTWKTLVNAGTLKQRDFTIGWSPGRPKGKPADKLTFNGSSALAERWNRAPEVSIAIYNNSKMDVQVPEAGSDSVVDDATGMPILPVVDKRGVLTLYDALDEAYVVGCQFASVITNIPDFDITKVEFSDNGGYHEGISPLIGMLRPKYFVDEGDNLWIIWTGDELPGGVESRALSISAFTSAKETLNASERTNRMYLYYQVPAAEEGDILETDQYQEVVRNGTYGADDYSETVILTDVTRRKRGGETIDEWVTERTSSTHATQFNNLGQPIIEEIERDVLNEQHDSLGRKTGHTRNVQKQLPDTDGVLDLRPTMIETNQIVYGLNPLRPWETVIKQNMTRQTGAVLKQNDRLYLDNPLKTALPKAHVNGYLDPDENNEIVELPLKSIMEEFRIRGGTVGVHITVTNLLNGVVESSKWEERPGNVAVPNRKVAQRRVLLKIDGDDTNLKLQEFNTGEVPAELARRIGKQELQRRYDPPMEYGAVLTVVDDTIRPGMLMSIDGRNGFWNRFFVESRSIGGSGLGTKEGRITMEIGGEEVPAEL